MTRTLLAILLAGVVLLVLALLVSITRGAAGGITTALLLAGGSAWSLVVLLSWKRITYQLTRRSTRYGLNALFLSLLVFIILLMVGFIADRHVWRWDFSATREFSLSEKTLNVLQGIDKAIDIYVYYDRAERGPVKDLLDEYVRRNRNLRVHLEDLNKDPERAERHRVSELGTLVFDAGDKQVHLKTFSEEDVTNALIKVSRPGQKRVYFTTGHGEKDIEGKGIRGYRVAAAALQRENYDPRPLSLTEVGGVPADCDVLVIASPKSRFLDQEQLAVQRYLESGGRLFCLLDPRFMSGFEVYLSRWGIEVGNDRVIDPSPTGQLLGHGPATPLVNRFGVHPITKQFRQPVYFPDVRSVRRQKLYQGKAETASLAFTSEQSWAETQVSGQKVSFDPEDIPGPISVAMASRLDLGEAVVGIESAVATPKPGDEAVARASLEAAGRQRHDEARVVVFGDSDFASNKDFNDMGNGNLFLNAVAWLAEDEELIALRPKRADFRSISLTTGQIKLLNVVAIGLLPGIVALAGLLTVLRRRATS